MNFDIYTDVIGVIYSSWPLNKTQYREQQDVNAIFIKSNGIFTYFAPSEITGLYFAISPVNRSFNFLVLCTIQNSCRKIHSRNAEVISYLSKQLLSELSQRLIIGHFINRCFPLYLRKLPPVKNASKSFILLLFWSEASWKVCIYCVL